MYFYSIKRKQKFQSNEETKNMLIVIYFKFIYLFIYLSFLAFDSVF